jgi:DnaJ-class molecular chaperone
VKRLKKTKVCVGCGDNFLTFKNYDYCKDCAINGNRYINKSRDRCPECDGSGIIKFRNQKPRPCKLCYLTNMKKKPKLTKEEKY